ncbi:MAG: GxxExxY protein [Verrucomicrobiota bacterium]
MSEENLHAELTQRIIGIAMEVHRELRNGLDEKLYENAMCIDFADQNIFFDQQKRYTVFYKKRPIGNLIPDLIIDNSVIVDAKVVESFNDAHLSQMIGYLKITGLRVGLLLNFKHASLKIKRITI